ncbi:metal ABC transporter solute-binding protein, Zn/Mn family [Facklamia languida]
MKNILKKFVVFVVALGLFGGSNWVHAAEAKPKVTVTTTFLQDMVKVLAGDLVEVDLIIPAGEDPHRYTTKPKDLEKLTQADLVLYHGLHFEGRMIDLLEPIGHAVSQSFTDQEIGQMDEDGESVVDPHFWFDIPLYKKACEEASQALKEVLPDSADTIDANLQAYLKELDQLDQEVKEKIQAIPEEGRYLITPHDAFNYFSRRYDIPVKAPQGVSTDSEVSNKDIQDTVQFIVDHKIKAIFAESTTDPERMAKLQEACKTQGFDVQVVSGEDQELFSDSLASPGKKGDTFLEMFRHNADLIYDHLK